MTDISFGTVLRQLFNCDVSWDDGDVANVYSDPRQILLAWAALTPELIQVEGTVVLGPLTDKQCQELQRQLREKPKEVDLSSYRWLEVPYQFSDRTSLTEEQGQILAQVFAEAWLMQLNAQFPGQNWRTGTIAPEETGSVVGVYFENT